MILTRTGWTVIRQPRGRAGDAGCHTDEKDLCEEPEYYVNLVERQAQGAAVCAVSAVMGEGMEHVQRYLGAEKR